MQYHYTYDTLHVSQFVLVMYSELQAPPWGARLLILMWKAPNQRRVVEYSIHRWTLDSKDPSNGCT